MNSIEYLPPQYYPLMQPHLIGVCHDAGLQRHPLPMNRKKLLAICPEGRSFSFQALFRRISEIHFYEDQIIFWNAAENIPVESFWVKDIDQIVLNLRKIEINKDEAYFELRMTVMLANGVLGNIFLSDIVRPHSARLSEVIDDIVQIAEAWYRKPVEVIFPDFF